MVGAADTPLARQKGSMQTQVGVGSHKSGKSIVLPACPGVGVSVHHTWPFLLGLCPFLPWPALPYHDSFPWLSWNLAVSSRTTPAVGGCVEWASVHGPVDMYSGSLWWTSGRVQWACVHRPPGLCIYRDSCTQTMRRVGYTHLPFKSVNQCCKGKT
jgi:hypothetical protein